MKKRALVTTMGKYVEHLYHCLVNQEVYQHRSPLTPARASLREEENGDSQAAPQENPWLGDRGDEDTGDCRPRELG